MSQILFLISSALFCGQTEPAQFELQMMSGERLVGFIQKMNADGVVAVLDHSNSVPGTEVVALRRHTQTLPAWPRAAHCVLSNGDRIVGTPFELSGTFLRFTADCLRNNKDEAKDMVLKLPVTWLSVLWIRSPDSIDVNKFPSVFGETRKIDQIVLRNGDIVSGTVTGLDAKNGEIQIESNSERRTIEMKNVVVITFSNRLNRSRKPSGSFGRLVLANGTRLSIASPSVQSNWLSAQTTFKDAIHVSLSQVAALDFFQGRVAYLSDLKPVKYQYRTYQGEEFDWLADRNFIGRQLTVQALDRIQFFDKGIAVHGESALSYDLEKKYRRFECLVGLDAKLGRRGNAVITVLVDGKEYKPGDIKTLTIESGVLPIVVDVTAAKELTLCVKWGDGGNIGDYVNWCDARIFLAETFKKN